MDVPKFPRACVHCTFACGYESASKLVCPLPQFPVHPSNIILSDNIRVSSAPIQGLQVHSAPVKFQTTIDARK